MGRRCYQVREVVTWGGRQYPPGHEAFRCEHHHRSLGDARRCAKTRRGLPITGERMSIQVVDHGTCRVRERYHVREVPARDESGDGTVRTEVVRDGDV